MYEECSFMVSSTSTLVSPNEIHKIAVKILFYSHNVKTYEFNVEGVFFAIFKSMFLVLLYT